MTNPNDRPPPDDHAGERLRDFLQGRFPQDIPNDQVPKEEAPSPGLDKNKSKAPQAKKPKPPKNKK